MINLKKGQDSPSLSDNFKKEFNPSTDATLSVVNATLAACYLLLKLANLTSVHNLYAGTLSSDTTTYSSFSDESFEQFMRIHGNPLNGVIASIMVYCCRSNSDTIWLYSKFKDLDDFDHEMCRSAILKASATILSREPYYSDKIIELAKEVRSSLKSIFYDI